MTWKDITVWKYQQLAKLYGNDKLTEIDMAVKACAIVYDYTEQQVDSMDIATFNKMAASLAFLKDVQPEYAPVKTIEVNGRRYECVYDVRRMKAARYLEAKAFGGDVVGNLHKIAASMVHPLKRTWYGRWVRDKYDAEKHEQYAEDMRSAPFIAVYGSVLFFCKVFAASMESLKGYLLEQLPMEKREELEKALTDLCSILDGYTKQSLLPSLSE